MQETLEQKISSILERNKKVEADKAWETSKTRRTIIAIATYLIVLYFLLAINAPNPYFNALIPAVAFILSTLSLPFIKNWWVENHYKK